jgi:hypothetical protein
LVLREDTVEFIAPAAHEQVLDVIKRNAAMAQTAPDQAELVKAVDVVRMADIAALVH